MTINGKIIDEKLQHGINREAAKISVPLSGKTDKIDKIKELTDQIKSVYLIYYFKSNTASKKSDDFNNGMEPFRKIQCGETKQEKARKIQNIFKSNLNKKSRGIYKSDE